MGSGARSANEKPSNSSLVDEKLYSTYHESILRFARSLLLSPKSAACHGGSDDDLPGHACHHSFRGRNPRGATAAVARGHWGVAVARQLARRAAGASARVGGRRIWLCCALLVALAVLKYAVPARDPTLPSSHAFYPAPRATLYDAVTAVLPGVRRIEWLLRDHRAAVQEEARQLRAQDALLAGRVARFDAERCSSDHGGGGEGSGGGGGGGKLAFLFLTRGHLPLAQLWGRFFKGHESLYSIYVHSSDTSLVYTHSNMPSDIFIGRQIPSAEVGWGDITMVDAERRLLELALLDPANEHFLLISEMCVPLWPFPFVYNYLMSTQVSFVESYDCPLSIGFGRYNAEMAPEVSKQDFKKGSQWFALRRRHALIVINDMFYYSKFQKYCRRGNLFKNCYPDEHYVQTLLLKMDPQGVANYTVTFADWSKRQWHPKLFTAWNVTNERILHIKNEIRYIRWRQYWHRLKMRFRKQQILEPTTNLPVMNFRNGFCAIHDEPRNCFLFARKFHPSTLDYFLNHSREVLGF